MIFTGISYHSPRFHSVHYGYNCCIRTLISLDIKMSMDIMYKKGNLIDLSKCPLSTECSLYQML